MNRGAAPGAASLAAAAGELIGPLADSATPKPLPWLAGGAFDTEVPTRQPLLLVRLERDLGAETLSVTVRVGATDQPVLTFAEWSECGSTLCAFAAPVDALGVAAQFAGTVSATLSGSGALTPAETSAIVGLELVQGGLGKLLAVVLSEKARLRRQAREIRMIRSLRFARGHTLDRIGADLGVPRFSDRLDWDGATGQLTSTPFVDGREPDDEYRSRLRILREIRLPSPTWISRAINGDNPAGPTTGWMADVGYTDRISIDETANPLLIGFRLISPGRAAERAELLKAIRSVHLVWPSGSVDGDTAHASRMLPPVVENRIDVARQALGTLGLPPNEPVSASVALALATLLERQAGLGSNVYRVALGGQRDDGGSRFELGFGVRLAAPANADLDAAVAAAAAADDLVAVPRADDPIAGWLLRACGFRSWLLLDDGSVFASTLATGALVVDAAPGADATLPLGLSARLESPGDADHDAPLAPVIAAFALEGLLPVAGVDALIAGIQPSDVDATLPPVLARLDLPAVLSTADLQSRLAEVARRSFVVFDLGATTPALLADPPKLARLFELAAAAGASSGLPVLTAGGSLALIIGLVDLPLAGNNIAARYSVAYRWQVRALSGTPARLSARVGGAVSVTRAGTGISMVSVLAYVRTGANDPYEWRPRLADGSLLSLAQYEHLMNILELVTPIGVEVNTWDIRRRHVDVDGSGVPTAMSPSAARTYHRYRPLHD